MLLSFCIENLLNLVSLFEAGSHILVLFLNYVSMCFFVFTSVCLLSTLILLLCGMESFELKFLNQDGDLMF